MNIITGILIFICAIAAGASKPINLYIKALQDDSIQEIGVLDGKYIHAYRPPKLNPDINYCFGTSDLANHECFSYTKGLDSLELVQFHVFLDKYSEAARLSVNYDQQSKNSNEPQVITHSFQLAPSPNLNPESLKGKKAQDSKGKQRVEKVVERKIVKVKDEHGNEVEKEVEQEVEVVVDNRSWIQKNWMYIVPPLILFLVMTGEEPKK